jgi:putative hemolysin
LGRQPIAERRHIIDELLEERTDALQRAPFLWKLIKRWCLPFLKYQEAVSWADRLARCDGSEAIRLFAEYLDLDVRVSGLEHVPRTGRIMLVANHPTGFADAFAVHGALGLIRPDLRYFANRDVARMVPGMRDVIIPIEWLRNRRTQSAMRETLKSLNSAFKEECAVLIFPGGGIARGSLVGLKELDWLPAAVEMIRRYDCTVIPLHIRARNSMLYYALDAIHHELRDLVRFREVFAKRQRRFDLTIGPAISSNEITEPPDEATRLLQAYVERDLKRTAAKSGLCIWPRMSPSARAVRALPAHAATRVTCPPRTP